MMIEFIIASSILVGKADIAHHKVQYEFLNEDGIITTIVNTEIDAISDRDKCTAPMINLN